jgi:FtsH-binding integral membrane protein
MSYGIWGVIVFAIGICLLFAGDALVELCGAKHFAAAALGVILFAGGVGWMLWSINPWATVAMAVGGALLLYSALAE